jgi:hypothetical protein
MGGSDAPAVAIELTADMKTIASVKTRGSTGQHVDLNSDVFMSRIANDGGLFQRQ